MKVEEDIYHINGRVILDDITEQFGIEFEGSEEVDTIGGWIQMINTDAEKDDYINTEEDKWIVLDAENHQIKQVALLRHYNKTQDDNDDEDTDID